MTRFLCRAPFLAVLLASAVLARAGVSYDESAVFSFDTRDYLTGLAGESVVFTFDTRAVDGLQGAAVSGSFFLDTRTQALSALAITGPTGVVPRGQASYHSFITYSDGRQEDVSASAKWSLGGTVPGGTVVLGGNLRAGNPGTPATVELRASYQTANGRKEGAIPVVIGDQFSVALGLLLHSLGGNSYRVDLRAYPSGGAAPISYTWDTNADGVYGDLTGLSPSFTVLADGATHRVAVRATDALNRTATFEAKFPMDKPTAAGQPVKYAPASTIGVSAFLDGSGQPFQFDLARVGNGLIVITHGADDDGKATWIRELVAAIEARIPAAQRPNILVYDWSADASPVWTLGDLVNVPSEVADSYDITKTIASQLPKYKKYEEFFNQQVLKGTTKLADALADKGFVRFANGIRQLDPLAVIDDYSTLADGANFVGDFYIAQAHAQILAASLETEALALPQRVDFSKKIHFIGDGEGGWLLAEAAVLLKDRLHYVDRVTTLDSTLLLKYHFEELADPGYFERVISSAPGDFAWPLYYLPPASSHRSAEDVRSNAFLYLTSGLPWFHHERARKWYRDSATPTAELATTGFYNSPFVGGPNIPKSGGAGVAKAGLKFTSASGPPPATSLLDGFTTFGAVSESSGTYTVTENADAGIYRNLTLPAAATTLRFQFRFSGTTDRDALGVRFGQRPECYLGLDTQLSRGGFHRASVLIEAYAGKTDDLVFTLVSRGQSGAIVEIKEIEIIEPEDPDGDGLTNAQELAVGSNPHLADSDWDGLSDAFEVNVSHTNPALADSDGDGQSDFAELAAGTNPMNSHSVFAVTEFSRAGGGFLLRWSALSGKTYRILRSTTVDFASFDVIASGIAGVAPTTTYNDTTISTVTTPAAFYRIEAEE